MSSEEFEVSLLKEYMREAGEAVNGDDLELKIDIYVRQLAKCRSLSYSIDFQRYDSVAHYLRARLALQVGMGMWSFANDLLAISSTTWSGSRSSEWFDRQDFKKSRVPEAIAHLSRAIQLYDAPYYRIARARLLYLTRNNQLAMADLDHVLGTIGVDDELYREARKLKDEIETKGTGGGCLSSVILVLATAASVGIGASLLLA